MRVVHHYGARPEFVVLGGLVPELLCAGSGWRHAGTTDVDVQVVLTDHPELDSATVAADAVLAERPSTAACSILPEPRRQSWRLTLVRKGTAVHTRCMVPTDGELNSLSHDDLVQEVVRLRSGIRRHRDGTGDELCWHHPQLWGLLPESTDPVPDVPEWPQFLRGCIRYRQSLDDQLPAALRMRDEHDG